jgi:hypothetical protein
LRTVEILLDHGADVNAQTKGNTGSSVLFWAREYWNDNHEVIQFIESRGAKLLQPGAEHHEL